MIDRPDWLSELQKPPEIIPRNATRPSPLLLDAEHHPITTPEGWERRRAELVAAWQWFLGTIRSPRAVSSWTVLDEDQPGPVVRQLVRYEAESGLPVDAYLLRPAGDPPSGGRPGAVVFHSTTDATIRQPAGLEGPEDKHIGLHLARRGYVAFCPRNYLWEYGRPGDLAAAATWLRDRCPGITGMAKMLFDAVRAVDLLAAQPDVDPRRLGAIGHSLGGKEVLYLAAFDKRIRAAVSSEGGIGLTYSNWDAPWYLGDAIHLPGFELDHGQVLAMAAPRAFLLVGGDSADGAWSWPYVEAALPVWSLTGTRDGLGLLNHKQGHSFPQIAQDRSYAWLDWFLRVPAS